MDQRSVVGLERDAQVELQHSVGPEQGPVSPTGQHLAPEPGALELSTRDRRDHPRTVRDGSDLLRAGDHDLKGHQQP